MGVTFPILDQWLQKLADGMKAKADSLGIELTIVSAEEKADVQLSQVENFVSQGFDAILVIPQDTDASGPITEAAQSANIPLIYVAKNPAERPATVPYIGSDSIVAGTMQMEALAKLAGGKGNVAILQGDPAQETARDRTQGCKDVIAKNPGMKVIKEQAGNWYRDKGQSIMENWLQSGDQIDVVCANNDEMALGAINAIKAANKKLGAGGILVGGVDATSDALASMEAGDLAVTIFQDAVGQGNAAIEAAVKLTKGEKVDEITFVPYQLVTPENMKDFQ
nr:sugar ABC transporter substrate-binding protein [Propionicimonas sp.]